MATKILSEKKVKALIAARNAEFKGASRAEKRVLIAKDVIAQIKSRRFIPQSGDWLNFGKHLGEYCPWASAYNEETGDWSDRTDDSIQVRYLDKTVTECYGCALGGLMLACTLYNNKITFADDAIYEDIGNTIEDGKKIPNGLNTIFSVKQLKLIEIAFEVDGGQFSSEFTVYEEDDSGIVQKVMRLPEEQQRALDFGTQYFNESDRLIAIMRNIVKNEGKFVP